jgi:WD40 repeat protein
MRPGFQARRAESARHALQIEQAQQAWGRGEVSVAASILSEAAEPFQRTWEQRHLLFLCRRKALPLFHEGNIEDVAMSADGRLVASGSTDGTVKVWDAATGTERFTLKAYAVSCVAVSADGKRIVSGSADGTARVWDAGSGKILLTLEGLKGRVEAVGISADGRRIVSGSEDVKTWDATTGQLIRSKENIPGYGLAISADGRLIARGQARPVVWEAATGVELPSFKADAGKPVLAITSLAFTPDGQRSSRGPMTAPSMFGTSKQARSCVAGSRRTGRSG